MLEIVEEVVIDTAIEKQSSSSFFIHFACSWSYVAMDPEPGGRTSGE
jgi:hypothetical protein